MRVPYDMRREVYRYYETLKRMDYMWNERIKREYTERDGTNLVLPAHALQGLGDAEARSPRGVTRWPHFFDDTRTVYATATGA